MSLTNEYAVARLPARHTILNTTLITISIMSSKAGTIASSYHDTRKQLLALARAGEADSIRAIFDSVPKATMSAYVNARDKSGNTLLLIACRRGHRHVVRMLIDYGADLECKKQEDTLFGCCLGINDVFTPIQLASYYNHTAIVGMLREAGAIETVAISPFDYHGHHHHGHHHGHHHHGHHHG